MTHLLDGCVAKIQRTDEQIKILNAEINEFLRPDAYSIVTKPHNDGILISVDGPEPPLRFAVLAGEIVHHLRSVYDHIITALVLKAGKSVTKRHIFPVCSGEAEFKDACQKGKIKHVPSEAVALIKAIQPFKQPGRPENHWLMVLNNLDVADKHKLLVVLAASHDGFTHLRCAYSETEFIEMQVWMPRFTINGSDKIELHIGTGGKTPTEVKGQPRVQIVFDQVGTTKAEPLVPCLVQLRENTIFVLEMFANFFS